MSTDEPKREDTDLDRSTKRLEKDSYKATITASIVAIISLVIGLVQFWMTQTAQRDTIYLQKEALEFDRNSKAIDLFNDYNKHMVEMEKLPKEALEKSFWSGNLPIHYAQSIHDLEKDNPYWLETIKFIILDHQGFIKNNRLECKTFTKEFLCFIKRHIEGEICSDRDRSESEIEKMCECIKS